MPSPQEREQALFALALEKPVDKRPAFLDAVCDGDAALRQRLEARLAAHDQPDESLPTAVPAAKATLKLDLADAPDEAVGQTLGRYKLLEKVGEGGYGVVYVAEQTVPVRRRVALKVIKLGMDTKAVVARFEAERQALAMMDHPNIAKVLDAGTTDTGRPFFVMELVRGIRITDYCDQNNLSTNERLDLFIKICQAIQHAHQKGIIHRDIKPSNILVTLHDGVPIPKVIDFGIAKATEGRLTDATVYTQLHQFIGTPAYMSPEQAEMSGLDIDTRSDIYSLGVLLYELLAGSTPFDANELMASGIDQMRKTIREKEPVRPSTRFATLKGEELTTTAKRRSTETSKLLHQLKGDLDWIVMKCLEKDRTRRYETANGVAADIKRHLNNEPVVARPPSRLYEFQKTVRRHKFGFAATAAIILILAMGIVVSTWQSVRATHAKREALAAQAQADAARQQAEGLVGFMIQDLQPALKDYGRLSILKQVDEKTVSYYSSLPPELRNAKTVLAQADAITALADILHVSGDDTTADLKGREALALYQGLAKNHPEIPEAAAGALRHEWVGYAYTARPPHSSAELDVYQQAIVRQWQELAGKFPDTLFLPLGMGDALGDRISFAALRFNKPQEAVALGLELQAMLRKRMTLHPEDKRLPTFYAQSEALLATAYAAVGDQDKAVQVSEEAEAYFEQALKDDPGNLALLYRAAQAAQNLSYRVAYVSQKRSRDAELIARERYRTLTALDPSNVSWRYGFVSSHMMECYYFEGTGENELARQALKKFDSLLQDLVQRGELQPWDAEKLSQNSIDLARTAAYAGDQADARAQLATGETRFQARYNRLPAGSFDRIQARIRWLHLKSGVVGTLEDWVELERLARESLTLISDGLQQRPGDSELRLRRAVAQYSLGDALLHQGNAPEAVSTLEQAVTGFRDTPPAIAFAEDREGYAAYGKHALAMALAKTGDLERAKSLMESVITGLESAVANNPKNWGFKSNLANCLVQLAGWLDPAKPEEAARRQTALDRAEAILTSPESQGQLGKDDKETLAKIVSLRAAVPK
ncbi:MAG TPA: protein kinase [Verrucomicrobiae bacterium]|nr:protein kinase [Verrucomicrobiae bacterium]